MNDITTVTGDLSETLEEQAWRLRAKYPDSVRAYALYKALSEVRAIYEDEQGIPTSEALTVDRAILVPVRSLFEDASFQSGEIPNGTVVEDLVAGLMALNG